MISLFFLSVTSLCVSSPKFYFPRHLLVRFIQFRYKHYDGFTSCHIPRLRPPKTVFRRVIRQKIQFSDLLEGKGYFFESYFYSKLGNANLCALIDGKPFSWTACCNNSAPNFFRPVFIKKNGNFWNFSKQVWPSPFPTSVLNLDAHFLQTFL